MTHDDQVIWLNGAPLIALAVLYLGIGAWIASSFVRRRAGATLFDWAQALLVPAFGVAVGVFGVEVLRDEAPIGGAVWIPFGAIVVAAVPGLLFASRLGDRALAAAGVREARDANERASLRERELQAIEAISGALGRADDPESIARVLLDEIAALLTVEFAGLVLVDDELTVGRGLLARRDGEDFDFWRGVQFDLRNEPSGVASAAFEVAPVTVYDTEASPMIDRGVAEAIGARSAAFVPLVAGERVIAVLAVATTRGRRAFSTEELGPLRTAAAETALALERTRSAAALADALERERLVSSIARKVRSELDFEAVLRVAVEETGRALGLARCYVRLGDGTDALPIEAEWTEEGVAPMEPPDPDMLPVSSAAARSDETVAVADVAAELDGPGRDLMLRLGVNAVLATPIVVFDRSIGVLVLHRAARGPWAEGEARLAEAVARELGLGIHTARLLRENAARLRQQHALLRASQVVTNELRPETVLQLLVDEVSALFDIEAADCYLYTAGGRTLRCAAVRGLDPEVIGFELPAGRGLPGRAISEGVAVREADDAGISDVVIHPAYAGFRAAMAAPMTWAGQTRGVLGVGSREPGRTFSDAEADALTTFATLASLALRNAESFEQRERDARVEAGFSRIASLLGEPVALGETLDAIALASTEALGADVAAVVMPSEDGFRLAGGHALPEALRAAFADGLPAGAEVLESAASGRETIASSSLQGDERFGDTFRAATGAASLLAVPLVVPRGDRPALAILLFHEQHVFSDDDLDLARKLGERAKAALARTELFEVERRSRLLAQQLADTGSLFSGELEPGAVLDQVAAQAPVLLRADASLIRLLDGEELVAVAAVGVGAAQVDGSRVPLDARPAGTVVGSRAPVAIIGTAADDPLRAGEPMLAHGFASYLAVPLLGSEGDLQGVLAVLSRRRRAWQEEEIEALVGLAAMASVAYAKAELYQQVELERERSVAILGNVADGIVAVDRDERIVLWNSAAEEITGVPSEEALGRTVVDVLQRDLRSESGSAAGDRLLPIRRVDTEVWLSLTEAVMRDATGETAGRIFAFRDISGEHVVEQMRSAFVSTVSHELRAPLTSIYGFAATLLREDVQFEARERRTFLGYIESEAQRLNTIVDKLLSVARLDSGDLELSIAPVDVRSVITEAVDGARAEAQSAGHEFVLDLPEVPLAARTDPDKLRQVLANLVDNAVRFSPAGGRVTVGASRRGETIVLSVADQGVGIPDTEQDRIFSKFYRVGDAQTGGTGVGLFIVQGLVNALGGRITVRSAEGRGSSFVVELPTRAAEENVT